MKKFFSGAMGKVTVITIVALLVLCVFLVKMSQDEKAVDVDPAVAVAEWTEPGLPVFVDFTADWCPYCKQMEPVIEELRQEYADKVTFVTVNIDEQRKVAQAFGVSSVPNYMVLDKTGTPAAAYPGATDRVTLTGLIGRVLEGGPS